MIGLSLLDIGRAADGGPSMLLASAVIVFAAALLRGFTGFGFALAAVPLLGLAMPPSRAVPFAICLQLCGGVIDVSGARRHCDWLSLRWLTLGALVGTPIGTVALTVASPAMARLGVSAICLAGTILLARGLRFRTYPRPVTTVAVGLASGLFNGLAAVPGPPVVAYYLATPLAPIRARASLLVFFLATSVVGGLSLWWTGLLTPDLLVPVLFGVPIMVAGTAIGQALFRRAGGRGHRGASVAILVVVSLVSGVRTLIDLV